MKSSKGLNITLWIVQVMLALIFLSAGFFKIAMPVEQLAQQMVWPGDVPVLLLRFIGVAEFLAGIGLILPSVLRIKPFLTPLAGAGLVAIQVLAILFHLVRGEFAIIMLNFTLVLLSFFIAWGRYKKHPILPK